MSERLFAKKPIYPIFGIIVTVAVFLYALLTVKSNNCLYFIIGFYALLFCFGYHKACIAILPFAGLSSLVFCGVTWLMTGDVNETIFALNRILGVCIAIIPGMGLPPEHLVRNFTTLKVPRNMTLGIMISISFFPLLRKEVRTVREAMKTRGAGSMFSPKIFYRSFLIPLVMRIVNISDTLALSVETRGFSEGTEPTVYKTVKPGIRDYIFLLLSFTEIGLAVAL